MKTSHTKYILGALSFTILSSQNLRANDLCLLTTPIETQTFFSMIADQEGKNHHLKELAINEALEKCHEAHFSNCQVKESFESKFGKELDEVTRVLVVVGGERPILSPTINDLQNIALDCLSKAESAEEMSAAHEAYIRACEGKTEEKFPCIKEQENEDIFLNDFKKIARKISMSQCDIETESYDEKIQLFSHEAAPVGGSSVHARFLQYKMDHKIQSLASCYKAQMDQCQIIEDKCYTKLSRCDFTIQGTKNLKHKSASEILAEKSLKAQHCNSLDKTTLKLFKQPYQCGKK